MLHIQYVAGTKYAHLWAGHKWVLSKGSQNEKGLLNKWQALIDWRIGWRIKFVWYIQGNLRRALLEKYRSEREGDGEGAPSAGTIINLKKTSSHQITVSGTGARNAVHSFVVQKLTTSLWKLCELLFTGTGCLWCQYHLTWHFSRLSTAFCLWCKHLTIFYCRREHVTEAVTHASYGFVPSLPLWPSLSQHLEYIIGTWIESAQPKCHQDTNGAR